MDDDLHDEIVRLETRMEELAAAIESCRKFILAGRAAVAVGAAVFTRLACRAGRTACAKRSSRVERVTSTPRTHWRQVRRFRTSGSGQPVRRRADRSMLFRSAANRPRSRRATVLGIGMASYHPDCKFRGSSLSSRITRSRSLGTGAILRP